MSTTGSRPLKLAVEEASPDDVVVNAERPPGPAGLATVSFLDGAATLAVDTALPDAVVSLALPGQPDERVRRLVAAVLPALAADDLNRWLDRPSPRRPQVLGATPPTGSSGPIAAPRSINRLDLFGRLAVGLDEVVRAELTEPALAATLVDLGAMAFDLAELDPSPDGVALVTAGLDRWEDQDPDGWDDGSEMLLAATHRKAPQWRKSLWPHRPDLANRLEALTGALGRRTDGTQVVARSMVIAHDGAASAPAAAHGPARSRDVAASATAPPAPVVDIAFDVDLDGRVIHAERVDHHLTVHLGGLDDDDLWLRVYEAGTLPRLLALAPVGAPERTWRSAVALIGPDVTDHDLLADVTRRPREPFRSPAVRRTERATHLGKVAARLSRSAVHPADPGRAGVAPQAWGECARAWAEAGDTSRADVASIYAEQLPVPRWAMSDPLLTDLDGRP